MVIPKEKLETFKRWQIGSFDAPVTPPAPVETPAPQPQTAKPNTAINPSPSNDVPDLPDSSMKLPTAEEVERVYEEARTSGYETGFAEGKAAAEQQSKETIEVATAQTIALFNNMRQALDQLEQSVADQLLSCAIEIAAQLTRGVIQAKTDMLLPIIREAIACLPLNHAQITLRLNPVDTAHVREYFQEEFSQTGTQIVEDHEISPGGCLLRAGTSEIDATIETRWKRVLESIGKEPEKWLMTS